MSNERWGPDIIDEWQDLTQRMIIKRFSTETRRAKHKESIEDLMSCGYTHEEARNIIELILNFRIRRLHFSY